MKPPPDSSIPVGVPHRTIRAVNALVYDYDDLGVKLRFLPVGTVFQPWEPESQWHGKLVPITLGDAASRFDWAISSPTGHFLQWNDFFCCCGTGAAPPWPINAWLQEHACAGPFADLAAISRRLRTRSMSAPWSLSRIDELLAAVELLARVHAYSAEMQLGAEGFDNTETAGRFARVQGRLLAAAREVLGACKDLSG